MGQAGRESRMPLTFLATRALLAQICSLLPHTRKSLSKQQCMMKRSNLIATKLHLVVYSIFWLDLNLESRLGNNSIWVLFHLNRSFKSWRQDKQLMGLAHPYAVKDNKKYPNKTTTTTNKPHTKNSKKKTPNTTRWKPQVPLLAVRLSVPELLALSEKVQLLFNASYSKERRGKWFLTEIKSQSQRPFVTLKSTGMYLIRFKFLFFNLPGSASQINLCFFYSKEGIKKKIKHRGKTTKNLNNSSLMALCQSFCIL